MKLLYIANARIPSEKAHSIQILKMCEAFADQNIDISLVVPDRKNVALKDIDVHSYYSIKNNFAIEKIKAIDPIFLLKFPQGIYIKFQILFLLQGLKKYLSKSKVDILFTRDYYLLPMLLGQGKKVVWEVHDLPSRKKSYVRYWQKCHKIIAITQGLKDELISLGVIAEKIFVASDAVDLESFNRITQTPQELRQELDLSLEKNIILYSGHLYGWKGADVLARAASDLSSQELVVFLGGTSDDVKRFKNDFGDKENIKIIGHVDFKIVPKYLKSADVLVLPNSAKSKISSHYTSPMKLFEYMAASKPIVASNLPSIAEILNKNNAVLVEPDNTQALAGGINQVLNDTMLGEKLVKQSALDVKQYDWNNRAILILKNI